MRCESREGASLAQSPAVLSHCMQNLPVRSLPGHWQPVFRVTLVRRRVHGSCLANIQEAVLIALGSSFHALISTRSWYCPSPLCCLNTILLGLLLRHTSLVQECLAREPSQVCSIGSIDALQAAAGAALRANRASELHAAAPSVLHRLPGLVPATGDWRANIPGDAAGESYRPGRHQGRHTSLHIPEGLLCHLQPQGSGPQRLQPGRPALPGKPAAPSTRCAVAFQTGLSLQASEHASCGLIDLSGTLAAPCLRSPYMQQSCAER